MIDELKEDMEVQIALSEAPDQVIATVKIVAFRKRDVEGNVVKDVVIDIDGQTELLPGEKITGVVKNEDGTFKIITLGLPPYSRGCACGSGGCGCGGG